MRRSIKLTYHTTKDRQTREPKYKFSVTGQTLCNPELADGLSLDSVAAKGQFMAGVGCALGLAFDNKSLFLDITFSWQPVATIRDRPVTRLDAQLEGTKLTVLDAAKWVTGGKVVCPCCNK